MNKSEDLLKKFIKDKYGFDGTDLRWDYTPNNQIGVFISRDGYGDILIMIDRNELNEYKKIITR